MAYVKKTSNQNQTLSRKEKDAQAFIKLGFLPHEGEWAQNSKRLTDAYKGKYWH